MGEPIPIESNATWFEVVTQVHGRDAIVETAGDWEDAIDHAEGALALLNEDLIREDTAFYCVHILAHWCDKDDPAIAGSCACWKRRVNPDPYKELVGETINDLFGDVPGEQG